MKVKIVPYTFGLEKEMEELKDTTLVGIEKMSITYMQEADTCSSSDEYQTITLTTRNGCSPTKEDAENEQAFYFDISIPEGGHWSVSDGNEVKALIDDFKKRIYLNQKKK